MLIVLTAAAVIIVLLRMHAAHTPHALRLPDGTDAFFFPDTAVEAAKSYPQGREIRVNGDAFIRAPAAASPLIVRSPLLVLTVTGESAFRITSYANEPGGEVKVLYGHVQAHKAYASAYSEPDILTGGEESMINRTIDFMERETFDAAELRAWSNALIASVRQ